MRWMRWHCPPDTRLVIRTLAIWGLACHFSVTEAHHYNWIFTIGQGRNVECYWKYIVSVLWTLRVGLMTWPRWRLVLGTGPDRASLASCLIDSPLSAVLILSSKYLSVWYTAVQSQKAVSAYLTGKQILPFGFDRQHSQLLRWLIWWG